MAETEDLRCSQVHDEGMNCESLDRRSRFAYGPRYVKSYDPRLDSRKAESLCSLGSAFHTVFYLQEEIETVSKETDVAGFTTGGHSHSVLVASGVTRLATETSYITMLTSFRLCHT